MSKELLQNNEFIGKPLMIGGTSDRRVVATCSYEARCCDLQYTMLIRRTRQLCANGLYIKGDSESYSNYSHLVIEVITDNVPLYEKAPIHEFYID